MLDGTSTAVVRQVESFPEESPSPQSATAERGRTAVSGEERAFSEPRSPRAEDRNRAEQNGPDSDPGKQPENGPPFSIHEVKVWNRSEDREKVDIFAALDTSSGRLHRSRKLAEFLRTEIAQSPESVKRASKLDSCGAWSSWVEFFTEGEFRLEAAQFCQQPLLCAFCAAGRALRQSLAAADRVAFLLSENSHLRPYLLTLTVRADGNLERQRRKLLDAWKRITQARRDAAHGRSSSVWSEFEGGILACEAKRATGERGKGKWHFHAHAVVLGRDGLVDPDTGIFHRSGETEWSSGYASGPMAQAWSDLLGYDANSDLRPLSSSGSCDRRLIADDLMEVFKYALKLNDLSFDDQWQAFQTLKGQRLVRRFGCLWGLKLPEQFADDLSPFLGIPFTRYFFRWLDGFQLDHSATHDSYQGAEKRW